MSLAADSLLDLGIAELAQRLRTRQVRSLDLTEAYLERIRLQNPRLNAFATVTADLARAQARAADAEIQRGRVRGPLHGVPYGAKDLLATAGIETSWGAAPCRGQVFGRDATVVRRLREAGAVLLGKLAMVEFAGGLGYRSAKASISGPGRNPWDVSRWTGGSSSGSGAAVAASLAGFAIGTETWGSILCPAAFCGVTGLRPTYGRVSRAGAMVCSWTYDKIGPLARSAADCRLVLQAISGPDPDDPTAAARPVGMAKGAGRPLRKLRGALIRLDFAKTGEPEVRDAFDEATRVLQSAGLALEEAQLPEFPASEVAGVIITAEALSSFERFYKDGSVKQLVDPYAPHQLEIAEAMNGADLMKAWRMRRALQETMVEFFTRYDVIVTPNFMSVAPLIEQDLTQALAYTDPVGAVGNSCGLPAIALPCGSGRHGMPVGFQIVAAPWQEATLLDLGELYQQRTEHHRRRPPL
jgi:aspartyl-tRNA(Asn)/glutamyl-tRNA(Gln) amidotransferase subunit A